MPSKKSKTFTDQFEELERIVSELEEEEDLDAGLKKFERGLALSKELKAQLKNVENKIENMKKDAEDLEEHI
ncbi:MAG: exodeoxyribonuclease VII small subunit [Patescibacteria group bacterium]